MVQLLAGFRWCTTLYTLSVLWYTWSWVYMWFVFSPTWSISLYLGYLGSFKKHVFWPPRNWVTMTNVDKDIFLPMCGLKQRPPALVVCLFGIFLQPMIFVLNSNLEWSPFWWVWACKDLHPGRLTWNPKMKVWKMMFLFIKVIFRFCVNFPASSKWWMHQFLKRYSPKFEAC